MRGADDGGGAPRRPPVSLREYLRTGEGQTVVMGSVFLFVFLAYYMIQARFPRPLGPVTCDCLLHPPHGFLLLVHPSIHLSIASWTHPSILCQRSASRIEDRGSTFVNIEASAMSVMRTAPAQSQDYSANLYGPTLGSNMELTLYAVFTVFCFVAPVITNKLGSRRTMFLGVMGYAGKMQDVVVRVSPGRPAGLVPSDSPSGRASLSFFLQLLSFASPASPSFST